jgi:hypothetical protein
MRFVNPKYTLFRVFLLLCGIGLPLQAQNGPGLPVSVYFELVSTDTTIHLDHKFITTGSELLTINGRISLTRSVHYSIDYRFGAVSIHTLPDTLELGPGDGALLHITYRYMPFTFSDTYQLYEFVGDTTDDESAARTVAPSRSFALDDIFSSHLQTSGSLIRGLSVGSNRDLTLQSGFRMQLAGNLSERYEIAATLTDENTPIQPEGTTQTLRELDKVYIQILSENADATFGDFDLRVTETEFSRLDRRLQGAMGNYRYGAGFGDGDVMVAGASMRGKYNTNEFRGQEGVQGPYRLNGRNNERAIIIVPGSERVYVDGEQMVRGEMNDYVIEYGNGEIVFTAQRLVTSASRIVVDFEYTDRQYNRNFFAAGSKQTLLDDRLWLRVGYYREGDDRDNPIDVILGEEEIEILRRSGTDRTRASRTGVRNVGINEETGQGNGQYVRRDTVVAGEATAYYVFDPGASDALYSISFTYVGEGLGEYRRVAAGQFEYTGPDVGGYLPVQFLPMPQLHQIGNTAMSYRVTDEITLFGEYSFSSFDGNRFSNIGNEFNEGDAYLFGFSYAPDSVKVLNRTIGGFDIGMRQRFVGDRYVSMDRMNVIEFNRQWDLPDDLRGDEMMREASFTYRPVREASLGTSYGTISRGASFESSRYDATLAIDAHSLPRLWYYIESIQSEDLAAARRGDWLRQRGRMFYDWNVREGTRITPGMNFEQEERTSAAADTDSLLPGSFSFHRIAPNIEVDGIARMNLFTELEFREDSEYLQGARVPESRSLTSRSSWQLREWKSFSSRLNFTWRTKEYTEPFRQEGRQDNESILIRSQTRYAPLQRLIETDLYYEVSTQRSARLERVFVRVPRGTGNYRYLGDLNEDGIANEDEFELVRFDGDFIAVTVPTDELFPVIDLKSSLRFRLTPSRLLQPGRGVLSEVVRRLSTETYLRVEEKSRDPNTSNIYLMRFSTFRDGIHTIVGNQMITQDLFLNEQSREFSMRFRYMERKGLSQYSLGVEENLFLERSVRLRWQLVEEIGNQIDVITRRDNVTATQPSNRERTITANTVLSDFSYRPYPQVEVGFVLEITSATDRFPEIPVEASINAQTVRMLYSIRARGQVRTEFSREQVLLEDNRSSDALPYAMPFELTGGRVEGLSWLWRAAFDYRVSRFVQASVQYDGRAEFNRPVIHQGRGEVRVFF